MKVKEDNFKKGKYGEQQAKEYLTAKGYRLIESNYDTDIGEIDLIMSEGDWLVFVEVKFKQNDLLGLPEEMINTRKLSQVRRVAEIFLLTNPQIRKLFEKYRIDGVCMLGQEIRHYKNIGNE